MKSTKRSPEVGLGIPGWVSRLSPARLGVVVGVLTAVGLLAGTSVSAVFQAHQLGGKDAVSGSLALDGGDPVLSARAAAAVALHTSMVVYIVWGVLVAVAAGIAAAFLVRRVRGEQLEAAGDHRALEHAGVQSRVWQQVAEELAAGSECGSALTVAAHRLLDTDGVPEPEPLFQGVVEQLPARSHLVRMYGPCASGKTVSARRLVEQEFESGRHVTVIRSGANDYSKCEYVFDDAAGERLAVVDSESLQTSRARWELADRFDFRKSRSLEAAAGGETIIVDAWWSDESALVDLVDQLAEVAADPGNNIRLVVVVNNARALSDVLRPFDTEIVFPGKRDYVDLNALHEALDRLSSDELVLARLAARVRGGGPATSRFEQRIVEKLAGADREYLSRRKTVIIEGPMPTTAGFQHGILKTPDGVLKEFALPVLPDRDLAAIATAR
ncbi:hypothetical protein P5V30_20670 [Mycobacteroides abscessus subsp. abscessus]|uniref:hypothetical protein n=1 Tax=Mycobacteroides abscessus TaxID=36809 RepID=UPI0009272BAE|nr:hypothetical protein [Mycobacteroides abscessus]MDO2986948.1 hypothetical protein [Mycobacteroides abscessus subsp. abscessus]SID32285.1 Uncharacterised protein [Mycobacteroides abscessus subsp. abscessus]SIJ93241.1 Uncharacterised protein [Mycobacteroides abscessus subsp. abscessus]